MKILLRVAFFCWLLLLLAGIDASGQIAPKPDYTPGSAAWKKLYREAKFKARPAAAGNRTTAPDMRTAKPGFIGDPTMPSDTVKTLPWQHRAAGFANTQPLTTDHRTEPSRSTRPGQLSSATPAVRPQVRSQGITPKAVQALATPACFVPVDASFTAIPRGTDAYAGPIKLPFSFNFYGTPYQQVYINTDGVLSFTDPMEDYVSFPLPYYLPMIAPFWADIDTRNPASGQVYYKVTPTHLIVTWDRVGYAEEEADKVNTFQLIIGVPGDALLGPNANVRMNYGDMQWATAYEDGDFPALVGFNGDFFQNYQQIGLFAKLDDSYDGPGGQHDGIGYLANKCFSYDVRTLANKPPLFSFDNTTRLIELNVGETVEIEPIFTAPEAGQTVTTEVRVDEGEICKVNYTVTNGHTSKVKMTIVGDACNAGVHIVYLVATDNGNPQQVTTVPLIIWVKQQVPVLEFPQPVDEDADGRYPLKATTTTGVPVYYDVLSGPGYIDEDTLVATGIGSILVRAYAGNDGTQEFVFKEALVCVPVRKPGHIIGDARACLQFEARYEVPVVDGAFYHWTVDGVPVAGDDHFITVKWKTLGTHQVAVHFTSNCADTGPATSFTVEVFTNPITGTFTKLLPSDGNVNTTFPLTFSWFPIEKALTYDIYIWPATASQPDDPMIKAITAINYTLYGSDQLQYGTTYKWRVVARGDCAFLESPVQTFQLRFLPDLVPRNIELPAGGWSGQPITIHWQMKNEGPGGTLDAQWFDKVYLSTDLVLDEHDIQGTSKINPGALNTGGTYRNTATFTLPQGISNKYYVIVVANEFEQLIEKDKTNNTAYSASTVNIQLTPPADLQVNTVTPPNNAFSGQPIEVIWTVGNTGPGKADGTGWMDILYLSKEEVLNPANAIKLGSHYHLGDVNAGGSYTQRMTMRLPDTVSGNYFVYVVTDHTNMLYEHAAEDNNTGKSGVVNIIPTPPVDLVVNKVTIPAAVPVAGRLTLSWQVENAGASATQGTYWRDAVYLSPTPEYNKQTAIELGSSSRSTGVSVGESYTAERLFFLPKGMAGNYYVLVNTDAVNHIYEQDAEHNNWGHSVQPLSITTPDLVVATVSVPPTGVSGQHLSVGWKLQNHGAATLENTKITDRILLSKKAAFEESQSIEIKQLAYQTGQLIAGADTARSITCVIPEGLTGHYYVYVQTDYTDTVFEAAAANNNTSRSAAAVAITLGPWADLQVTAVQAPNQAAAGELAAFSYTVTNKGNRATLDSNWIDRIYVSQQATWDGGKSILIRELPQQANIGKDSSYQVSTSVRLPGNIGGGDYYVYVVTNAHQQVYEHADSTNNTGRSQACFIKKYPPVDLVVTSVAAPATGQSGTPVSVRWTVQNSGDAITLPGQWHDVVYLSADTVWDAQDQAIKSFVHRGNLPVNGAYANEQEVVIPNGLSGKYYLLVVTDPDNLNYDAKPGNNIGLVRPGSGANAPIAIGIGLTPPANLVVEQFTTPDRGYAGQPIKVKFRVKNSGPGATNKGNWIDRIYLSKDVWLDKHDDVLGTYVRKTMLAGGAQYEDSLEVLLPANDLGNHVLIFHSDANDNVYEHQAEENLSSSMITIEKDALSDLIVTDIELPATGLAGSDVVVKWKVKNIGVNPARGYFQQSVFLSTDPVKDVADVLMANIPTRMVLAPQQSIEQSQTINLKAVSLRDYHALVHVDVLNNIAEVDDANNLTASEAPMSVQVEALPLGEEKQVTLYNNKDQYYRLDIADSLAGASLLITLEGDTAKGDNGLFVRYNQVPGMAAHDFASELPYLANQEIIVPALQPGTWYLLINGRMRFNNDQTIRVKAAVLHFGIRSVDATAGGNTGMATILVKGSKMNSVRSLRLSNTTGSVKAERIEVLNPTSLFARFHLNGVAPGVYDVVAESANGDTAVLAQSFSVVAGTGGILSTQIVSPPNTRPTNVLSFQVEFANTGNTDIINPIVRITSLGGAPIALKPTDLAKAGATLTLPVQEVGGPVGRLRPGAKGTVVVYAKATTVLGFMLIDEE